MTNQSSPYHNHNHRIHYLFPSVTLRIITSSKFSSIPKSLGYLLPYKNYRFRYILLKHNKKYYNKNKGKENLLPADFDRV